MLMKWLIFFLLACIQLFKHDTTTIKGLDLNAFDESVDTTQGIARIKDCSQSKWDQLER